MTQTDGPKRIRAIDRGLEIIEHLSNFGLSTLAELRHKTGLSNATLIRILATLKDRGWVRRNIVEGQYELTHSLESILGANVRAHPLAEIAAPILLNMASLARGFPSDLTAIIGTGTLEIVEEAREHAGRWHLRARVWVCAPQWCALHMVKLFWRPCPARIGICMSARPKRPKAATRINGLKARQ